MLNWMPLNRFGLYSEIWLAFSLIHTQFFTRSKTFEYQLCHFSNWFTGPNWIRSIQQPIQKRALDQSESAEKFMLRGGSTCLKNKPVWTWLTLMDRWLAIIKAVDPTSKLGSISLWRHPGRKQCIVLLPWKPPRCVHIAFGRQVQADM